jgi:hypothetical protein
MKRLLFVLMITSAYAADSVYIDQVGDLNTITVNQSAGDSQTAIILNQGHNNQFGITQQGPGAHMAFIGTPPAGQSGGNFITSIAPNNSNNLLNIFQTGSGNHTAAINLDKTTSNNNNSATIQQAGSAPKSFVFNLSGSGITANALQDNALTPDVSSMSIQCLTPPCSGYSYSKR